ncbi:MAG TPA: hypothetical protein VN613_02570 [Gemmatimonadaceae bacterium]|nr:hypothetical protein [Gemmatimonadaceae bacterium]
MQKIIRIPQFLITLCALAAAACGLPGKTMLEVAPQSALTGPKVIAVMGTRTDVVAALEDALAEHGFTFTRYQGRDRAGAPAGQERVGQNIVPETKYALEVTPDIFDRCVGGGFQLTSLSVSVIDRADNALLLRSTAKGRTEKCPPTSGTIFHDIAAAIDAAWQKR